MFSPDERTPIVAIGIVIILIQIFVYYLKAGEEGIKARWVKMTKKEKRETVSKVFWNMLIPLLIIAFAFMSIEAYIITMLICFIVWLFLPTTIRVYTRKW